MKRCVKYILTLLFIIPFILQAQADKDNGLPKGQFIGGWLVMGLAVIPSMIKGDKLKKAVLV